MAKRRRLALRFPGIATGVVLFVAGAVSGVLAYAWLGPNRTAIDPYVQGALVAGLAALVAAVLAIVGSWWGASKSSDGAIEAARVASRAARREAESDRVERREAAARQRRAELVGRVSTLSYRHAQEVSAQLSRWVELAGATDDSTMPPVSSTAPIQDAVIELYSIGSQNLADLGQACLAVLYSLDGLVYVAGRDNPSGVIAAAGDRPLQANVLTMMVQLINTELMVAGSKDFSAVAWSPDGTLPKDYLDQKRAAAEAELAKYAAAMAASVGGTVVSTGP